jgi:hypothetical protein
MRGASGGAVRKIEWVNLSIAPGRLKTLWGITYSIAEQIIRNVIDDNRVALRAIPRFQHVFKNVTGQRIFSSTILFAPDYELVEIDWNALLAHGRELLPLSCQLKSPKTRNRPSGAQPNVKARRGPEPGTTGYASQDQKLFPKIKSIIESGKARSPYGAAIILAEDIAGSGDPASKAKRVSIRYHNWARKTR